MRYVTAIEMAQSAGVDPKRFRQALRDAAFSWYRYGAPWTVEEGSRHHSDMERVLATLGNSTRVVAKRPITSEVVSRFGADETYILDLCDQTLGLSSVRQHRFDFLRGDPGQDGRSRTLPVDGWYAELQLVVEYRERQHTQPVGFFDRRMTVSGVGRGLQRHIYDQRRREILPRHDILLVEFDFSEFEHTQSCRLVRVKEDQTVVAQRLATALASRC